MDEIGEVLLVQPLVKGFQGLGQKMFQPAGAGDHAGVGDGIETFNQRRIRFRQPDDGTNADLLWWPRQPQAAMAAPCRFKIASFHQFIGNFHQMVAGNFVAFGHLGNCHIPVGMKG